MESLHVESFIHTHRHVFVSCRYMHMHAVQTGVGSAPPLPASMPRELAFLSGLIAVHLPPFQAKPPRQFLRG